MKILEILQINHHLCLSGCWTHGALFGEMAVAVPTSTMSALERLQREMHIKGTGPVALLVSTSLWLALTNLSPDWVGQQLVFLLYFFSPGLRIKELRSFPCSGEWPVRSAISFAHQSYIVLAGGLLDFTGGEMYGNMCYRGREGGRLVKLIENRTVSPEWAYPMLMMDRTQESS